MKKGIIVLLFCAIFVSCARRSGHKKQNVVNIERVQSTDKSASISISNNSFVHSDHVKMDGATIFRKYNKAVFMIFTTDGSNIYQGSGFFIGKNGLAVSNYHVFKGTGIGEEAIKLPGDDKAYKVVAIYQKSEEEDFILFRVGCNNIAIIPLAVRRPSVGDKVYAIGSPRGLENTFSSGEVSQWRDENLMQINALIDHGSSGGALINEYGEVVGVTSGTFYDGSQANLNYAWSIDVVKPYLK